VLRLYVWNAYGSRGFIRQMCWWFYDRRIIGHNNAGRFTKPARYQTCVQNLSIDSDLSIMRY